MSSIVLKIKLHCVIVRKKDDVNNSIVFYRVSHVTVESDLKVVVGL